MVSSSTVRAACQLSRGARIVFQPSSLLSLFLILIRISPLSLSFSLSFTLVDIHTHTHTHVFVAPSLAGTTRGGFPTLALFLVPFALACAHTFYFCSAPPPHVQKPARAIYSRSFLSLLTHFRRSRARYIGWRKNHRHPLVGARKTRESKDEKMSGGARTKKEREREIRERRPVISLISEAE